jgi:hypothetical protein
MTFSSSAKFEFTPTVRSAYENIIRLRLDEGKRLLDKETKENPANTLPLLYYNYIDFLKAFITEEKPYADSLRLNAEQRLRRIEHENANSPFFNFCKAEIILQTAFIKIKFRENISAAFDIRKSYKLAEENIQRYPDFILNRKQMGLLHVIVGNVPKEYHWLVSLAGMDGTITQGTDELNRAMIELGNSDFSIYKEEILFYLSQLQSSFAMDGMNDHELIDSLRNYSGENLLLTYCYVNLAMKAGENDKALAALNQKEIYNGTFQFAYLDYKKGMLRLRKLDWNAKEDFQNFVSHFKGINFIKAAYQKLGWIALLNGDRLKYKMYMDSCLFFGKAITDDDKDALLEAKDSFPPDVKLLRTRLLFDGGYYIQALKEISYFRLSTKLSLKDELEYTYRYARLFHKISIADKAIQYYQLTFEKGKNERYYYAANSALLLANIYEGEKEYAKANEYYEQCLSLRSHDYQNSIDQKAQAGLERVAHLYGISKR